MDWKTTFATLLTLLLLSSCSSTPTPDKKETSPPTQSPSQSKSTQKGDGDKEKKEFDYQEYIEKNNLSRKMAVKKQARKLKKKKYERILKGMAPKILQEWKEGEKEAQQLYQKAIELHYLLQFEKAVKLLKKATRLSPLYQPPHDLLKRIEFLQGERPLHLEESVQILREEKEITRQKRIPKIVAFTEEGQQFLEREKFSQARSSLKKAWELCQGIQKYHIDTSDFAKYEDKVRSHLETIAKRKNKS